MVQPSDELVALFSSPSHLYTTPVFIFIPTTLSLRPIGTTSLAQCTCTIGSRPIFLRVSPSLEPCAGFADAVRHPEIGNHIIVRQMDAP